MFKNLGTIIDEHATHFRGEQTLTLDTVIEPQVTLRHEDVTLRDLLSEDEDASKAGRLERKQSFIEGTSPKSRLMSGHSKTNIFRPGANSTSAINMNRPFKSRGRYVPPPITEDDEPGTMDEDEIKLPSFLQLEPKTKGSSANNSKRAVEEEDDVPEMIGVERPASDLGTHSVSETSGATTKQQFVLEKKLLDMSGYLEDYEKASVRGKLLLRISSIL